MDTPRDDGKPFLEMARDVVEAKREELFATWYDQKGKATNDHTFGSLWDEAGLIAYYLRNHWDVRKGHKVVLVYTPGLHFFAAFLGCLRCGVTAVLVYPPAPPLKKSLAKLNAVIEDCKPVAILTDKTILALKTLDQLTVLSPSKHDWPKLKYRRTDGLKGAWFSAKKVFIEDEIGSDHLAFLQYTSGSTSLPKAVMVTHGNIAANVRLLLDGSKQGRLEAGEDLNTNNTGASWLPAYHDLGLIYASIKPFIGGWRMHFMSPLTFIKNPLLWIEIISKNRVKWSVAPNFAYELVARKFLEAKARGEEPIPDLDLSSINCLANCAEPISKEIHAKFGDCFRDYGLGETWFCAGYGLAENVVGVSWQHEFRVSSTRSHDTSQFVAVGSRATFHSSIDIRIVDPQTNSEVDDGATGELWVSGPSVAAGYLNKPEVSEKAFKAKLLRARDGSSHDSNRNFLRTGDLAFIQDDYLFICGRIKDVIIINGVNYYPQDVEALTQEASAAVRPGCVAAFPPGESAGQDGIQVVFERSIPKTTSGKIQRRRTRQQLQHTSLRPLYSLTSNDDDGRKATLDADTETSESVTRPSEGLRELTPDEKVDTIFQSVLGEDFDAKASWESNGLSSLLSVELSNKLSANFPVSVPPDFQDKYATPAAFKEFLLRRSSGAFFPVVLPHLKSRGSMFAQPIPWLLSTALQAAGIAFVLLLLSVSTVPAYHFVVALNRSETTALKMLYPLAFAIWHLSFSLLVILTKWIVIGRYSATKVAVPSVRFLQWWLFDRLIDVWEYATGKFVLNTPLIWVFYKVLGVDMPVSVKVSGFLREFDLISIGQSVAIEHDVHCRKFGPWEEFGGCGTVTPTLRFRPIEIEDHSTIRGHLGLGSVVGEAARVERLAAVPEGSQIPDGVVAEGSPAYQSTETAPRNTNSPYFHLIGLAKVVWIFLELFLSALFGLMGVMLWSLIDIPVLASWRYVPILRFVFVVAIATISGLLCCILLKWTLIGRRRADQHTSERQKLSYWMVDYHYNLHLIFFSLVAEGALIVNLYLLALGLDIDHSKVRPQNFQPSKVDLISVKRSFLSTDAFDIGSGRALPISIEDCNVGHSVILQHGTKVVSTEIPPFTRVTKDVVGVAKERSEDERLASACERLWVDLAVAPVILVIMMSFVPTFEFFRRVEFNSILSFPVTKLALALAVHGVTWYLLAVLLHRVMYIKKDTPWSKTLYSVVFVFSAHFWEPSFSCLLWGTPFANLALRGLGCTINGGPLWFFGKRIYDAPLVSINGPTIVDSSWLNGHSVVRGKIELGPCHVGGVLHERTVCLAHTYLEAKEMGPFHFVAPTAAPPGGDIV
ncbi:Putative fatty-acid--CoA ligase FadD21 [Seminavis robusta]|uniref:Fatty-acid--CoA ligase FadD21 n=1 Tax=Seminavis robusta TaxID=568900 RepID=A0A9N8EW90_9STRA|nr:Putative fatty-acid--CoA ligase FadD21 [Seminavis robusta]|eukprot:Sro2103_g314670.1 Putative fatty-acid--CoA ligase FadD21 (1338) ;mRNA; r:564-4755